MIMESLRIFLFGMLGIFVVMGVLVLALQILNYFGNKRQKDEAE